MQETRKNDLYSCKLSCLLFGKDSWCALLKLWDFFRMNLSSTIFTSLIEDFDVK